MGSRSKTAADVFLWHAAARNRQARFGKESKNFLKRIRQIIDSFVIDPRSHEEKFCRHPLGIGTSVKELGAYAVGNEPDAVRRQPVAELKKKQRFAIRHNALICRLEGPPVSGHVIEPLPHSVLPFKVVSSAFPRLPAHCVVAALLKAVHSHDVGWTSLGAKAPPAHAVPEAKWSVNIDDVELVFSLRHVLGDFSREFNGTKTGGPAQLGEQIFEKLRFHVVL